MVKFRVRERVNLKNFSIVVQIFFLRNFLFVLVDIVYGLVYIDY